MQKVLIVNLNGVAYHLEAHAFEALGAYLERAEQQLRANPDRSEIVADLEQAIADKCSRFLGPHKTVITDADMRAILDEMGPVDPVDPGDADEPAPAALGASGTAASDATGEAGAHANDGAGAEPRRPAKRLYRLLETGVIGGVCSGLAEYFSSSGIDVTIVRVAVALFAAFEIVFMHTPFVVLAYLIALFVIPDAVTSEERAAARGIPFNAQQLIDEAKRTFTQFGEQDWKQKWTAERREWRRRRRAQRKHERQMHDTWPYVWDRPMPQRPGSYGSQIAAGTVMPVLTTLSVLAFWAMLYALLSLASTGGVRGWQLPARVPLWLALAGVIFLYGVFTVPLHAARRSCRVVLGSWPYEVFNGVMAVIIGLAVVWTAFRYSPEIGEWLRHLPEAWRNVIASFKA